jgi:hypothetical protein
MLQDVIGGVCFGWKPEGRELLQNLDLSQGKMLQRAFNKRGV